MIIHITRDGTEIGKFGLEDLQQAVSDGVVQVGDLAWMEGMTGWEPLSQVVDISFPAGSMSPPPPPPPNTARPSTATPNPAARHGAWKPIFGGLVALALAGLWYLNVAFTTPESLPTVPFQAGHSPQNSAEAVTIISHGHTDRGAFGTNRHKVSWRIQLRNNTGQRLTDLYAAYNWLDGNSEKLVSSNAITSIGAGEDLTVTGEGFLETRLFEQAAKVGIELMAPTLKTIYKILPLSSPPAGTAGASAQMPGSSSSSAQSIFNLSGDAALEQARKFVVGTWTYTGADLTFTKRNKFQLQEIHGWIKYDIRADGTLLRYKAAAVQNDWGQPDSATWEIVTGKFSDSGTRFYQLKINSEDLEDTMEQTFGGTVIYIRPDGNLGYRSGESREYIVQRGDKFPFSK